MRQHSGASVSELKRKYNHLVPSNERVLGLAESDNSMSLSEVRNLPPITALVYVILYVVCLEGGSKVNVTTMRCKRHDTQVSNFLGLRAYTCIYSRSKVRYFSCGTIVVGGKHDTIIVNSPIVLCAADGCISAIGSVL